MKRKGCVGKREDQVRVGGPPRPGALDREPEPVGEIGPDQVGALFAVSPAEVDGVSIDLEDSKRPADMPSRYRGTELVDAFVQPPSPEG